MGFPAIVNTSSYRRPAGCPSSEIKIDNGILEGINILIQSAKNGARGFRTTKNFILTIYLRLGKLKFNLPT
jgi:transposase